MKFGKPNSFAFVSESDGDPVGPELKVGHLTFHDMAEWACRCRLTEEVILNDNEANAIRVVGFERIDEYNGITTFQPCKI
ncbi:MAG: hypothetical protein PHH24_02945 [Candidatus Moranbacteria bacterium]|jgi:hypothetical protein|nr:hypothetical protein [Candidatus Moranbacteria bacterium]MDX9855593.1 hypothetical protein [Candidatus Moranbacteria bacterium]